MLNIRASFVLISLFVFEHNERTNEPTIQQTNKRSEVRTKYMYSGKFENDAQLGLCE